MLYPGEFYSKGWGRFIHLKPHMVYIYTYLKQFFDVIVVELENEFSRPETPEELTTFKAKALERVLGLEVDLVAISCWSSHATLRIVWLPRSDSSSAAFKHGQLKVSSKPHVPFQRQRPA